MTGPVIRRHVLKVSHTDGIVALLLPLGASLEPLSPAGSSAAGPGPSPRGREGPACLPGQGDSKPRWLHRASTWMRTFSRQGQDPFYLTQIKEGYSRNFLLLKNYKECNLPIGIVLPAHPVLPKSVWICCDVHPPPNEPTGFWTNSKHADQGAASRTTALQNTNVFSTESPGWFSSVGNTGWWSKWHYSVLT